VLALLLVIDSPMRRFDHDYEHEQEHEFE